MIEDMSLFLFIHIHELIFDLTLAQSCQPELNSEKRGIPLPVSTREGYFRRFTGFFLLSIPPVQYIILRLFTTLLQNKTPLVGHSFANP